MFHSAWIGLSLLFLLPAGAAIRVDLTQTLLQYIVNYDLKQNLYLTFLTVVTADWRAGKNKFGDSAIGFCLKPVR